MRYRQSQNSILRLPQIPKKLAIFDDHLLSDYVIGKKLKQFTDAKVTRVKAANKDLCRVDQLPMNCCMFVSVQKNGDFYDRLLIFEMPDSITNQQIEQFGNLVFRTVCKY